MNNLPPAAPAIARRKREVIWWTGIVATVHLVIAGYFIRHGALNPDEGFYAAAARAVYAGHLPYRDFGYTQPPLLPYLNGLLMQLTGYGLFEQRLINAGWAAAALGLAGCCLYRRSNLIVALGLVLLFTLSAPWMYFTHLGKTYSLTGLLVVLSSWLWLEKPDGIKKTCWLGLIGVVGAGCRLPALPFFGLLWLGSLWSGRQTGWSRFVVSPFFLLLTAAGLLLPFYLAAPESAVFWVFDFHRISVPVKNWHLAWQEIATLAPALWLTTSAVVVLTIFRPRIPGGKELLLGSAALLTLAGNLLLAGAYEEYGVPFLLPLALAVAMPAHRLVRDWPQRRVAVVVGCLIAVQFLATPVILWKDFPDRRLSLSQWLTPNAPRFNPDLPGQLARARQVVVATLPAGQPLFGPNLILALEADRPVPLNFLMGPFSVTNTLPPEQARLLHLATPADVENFLLDPHLPLVALFPQPQLNYGWTMPTFATLPGETSARWQTIYREHYQVVFQEGQFLLMARVHR